MQAFAPDLQALWPLQALMPLQASESLGAGGEHGSGRHNERFLHLILPWEVNTRLLLKMDDVLTELYLSSKREAPSQACVAA